VRGRRGRGAYEGREAGCREASEGGGFQAPTSPTPYSSKPAPPAAPCPGPPAGLDDNKGLPFMDFPNFFDALFELADMWAEGAEGREYAELLEVGWGLRLAVGFGWG
jgi:hypothetical protein